LMTHQLFVFKLLVQYQLTRAYKLEVVYTLDNHAINNAPVIQVVCLKTIIVSQVMYRLL
jgi:hypothetical protein